MTNLFSDPEYERLTSSEDAWLELVIEPFKFFINDVLSSIDNEIQLSYDDLVGDGHLNVVLGRYLPRIPLYPFIKEKVLKPFIIEHQMNAEEVRFIRDCFKIQVEENSTIDFENKTISGEVKLIKLKECVDEENINQVCYNLTVGEISSIPTQGVSSYTSHANEVIDIISADPNAKKTRSMNKKKQYILDQFKKIIMEDEWKIRDYKIIRDMAYNIRAYIGSGNMHALMNLTRLKCMVHKGQPIYSMKEIK